MNITICFIGDLMLGRDYDNQHTFSSKFISDNEENIYSKKILNYLNNCDLLVGNLETTITDSDDKYAKVFNFRVPSIYKKFIKLNKNQFMSIANNHILDYKKDGMIDTIINLSKLNIKFSGAGNNVYNAMKPAFFNIKGNKIGIISCSDHYDYWRATKNKYGIYFFSYNDYSHLLTNIKKLRKNRDLLILSVHWGSNYKDGIEEKFKKFAKDVFEAGINIIHGHSSHHVKCIKKYGNNLVIYGNGDFINDYAIDERYRNDLGMIVKITINKNLIDNIKIIPTKIINRKVYYTDKNDKNLVIKKIKNDCII